MHSTATAPRTRRRELRESPMQRREENGEGPWNQKESEQTIMQVVRLKSNTEPPS